MQGVGTDSTDREIAFGRFVVQLPERRLLIDGAVVKLSSRAFDILVALIASDGRMVTKNALLDIVWPRQVVEEANIHVHVSALRKLLGHDVISTVPGRGYRFVHPLGPSQVLHKNVAGSGGESVAAVPDHNATAASVPVPTASAGNLANSASPLYGRTDELVAVSALLATHRLVTLTGTGGIGKTRLALAAADAQRGRWDDGVWFVDLAPVDDPEQVPVAVARSLGIGLPADAQRDPTTELVRAVGSRSMLLLLDNAEHLREAVTALAMALLAESTRLGLLVTSRHALQLPQEQRFDVPPLTVPVDAAASDPRTFGALVLFEARAIAVEPRFRLGDRNVAAVADVCRRVDGVPLAIELAAARVRLLGVNGVRSGLLESLRVLGPGDPRASPRQQTLRATFDWSHSLLSPVESRLLRRLAVFVGGFTLHLAQQVGVDPDADARVGTNAPKLDAWGVLDALGELIDKSLVVTDDADPPRYRLLEVTRSYALEKLAETGEADVLLACHAHAVADLFRQAEVAKNEQIQGALSMAGFLQQLAPEIDNLRAARAWSSGPSGSRPLAIGLVAWSSEALRMLGLSTEASQAMLPFRDCIDDSVAPATAEVFWTGLCALGTHGRLPSAQLVETVERAERVYRRIGSPRRVHLGLYRKGFALMHLGRHAEARLSAHEMESLEAADWPAKAVALRLNLQAAVDGATGQFEEAINAFERAARLLQFERGEDDFVLNTLANLCMSLLCVGRHDEALTVARNVLRQRPTPAVRNSAERASLIALAFLGRLDEAFSVARQAMRGWRSDNMLPHMLSVFAWLALQQGRTADAVRLEGAARLQVQRMGLSNTPIFDRARSLVLAALNDRPRNDAELARWQAEGEQAHEDELVGLCLGDRVGPTADPIGSPTSLSGFEARIGSASSPRPLDGRT